MSVKKQISFLSTILKLLLLLFATVAASYTLVLIDVTKANNSLNTTTSNIKKIKEVFSHPHVFPFFSNPTIKIKKNRKVVEEIVTSSSFQPHIHNFLNILVEAQRIDLIKDIVKEYEFVYNNLTDIELAVVKLEPKQLSKIAKQVQKLIGAKNVRIMTVIDLSLVARFTVRNGNSGLS